jgi:hypothetical protein
MGGGTAVAVAFRGSESYIDRKRLTFVPLANFFQVFRDICERRSERDVERHGTILERYQDAGRNKAFLRGITHNDLTSLKLKFSNEFREAAESENTHTGAFVNQIGKTPCKWSKIFSLGIFVKSFANSPANATLSVLSRC